MFIMLNKMGDTLHPCMCFSSSKIKITTVKFKFRGLDLMTSSGFIFSTSVLDVLSLFSRSKSVNTNWYNFLLTSNISFYQLKSHRLGIKFRYRREVMVITYRFKLCLFPCLVTKCSYTLLVRYKRKI